jgi:hypothetical protein
LFAVVENLWDKYAVSSRELERERTETLKTLDGFLGGLGYLDIKDIIGKDKSNSASISMSERHPDE